MGLKRNVTEFKILVEILCGIRMSGQSKLMNLHYKGSKP